MRLVILVCLVWGGCLAQSHLPAHVGPGKQSSVLPVHDPPVLLMPQQAQAVLLGQLAHDRQAPVPQGLPGPQQPLSASLLENLVQQLHQPARQRTLALLARYKTLYERSLRTQQVLQSLQNLPTHKVQPLQEIHQPQTPTTPQLQTPPLQRQASPSPQIQPVGQVPPREKVTSPAQSQSPGAPSAVPQKEGADEEPDRWQPPDVSDADNDTGAEDESDDSPGVDDELETMQTSDAHDVQSAETTESSVKLPVLRKISGKESATGHSDGTKSAEEMTQPGLSPQSSAYRQSQQYLQLFAKFKPIVKAQPSPKPQPLFNSQAVSNVRTNPQPQRALKSHPLPWTFPTTPVQPSAQVQPMARVQPTVPVQPFPFLLRSQNNATHLPKLIPGLPPPLPGTSLPPFPLPQRLPLFPLSQKLPPVLLAQKIPPVAPGQSVPSFPQTSPVPSFPLAQKVPPFPPAQLAPSLPTTQVSGTPAPNPEEPSQPSSNPPDTSTSDDDDDTPFPWDSFRDYLRGSPVNFPTLARKQDTDKMEVEPARDDKANAVASGGVGQDERGKESVETQTTRPTNWWQHYLELERPVSELEPKPERVNQWWLKHKDENSDSRVTGESSNNLGLWESINRHDQEKREEEEKTQRRRERWGKVKEVLTTVLKRFTD